MLFVFACFSLAHKYMHVRKFIQSMHAYNVYFHYERFCQHRARPLCVWVNTDIEYTLDIIPHSTHIVCYEREKNIVEKHTHTYTGTPLYLSAVPCKRANDWTHDRYSRIRLVVCLVTSRIVFYFFSSSLW